MHSPKTQINKVMAKLQGNRYLGILFILLSVAWIGILFAESSQPPAKIINEISGLDKVAHFLAFSILASLLCMARLSFFGVRPIPLFSLPLLLATLVGIVEEVYQMTVPLRAGSPFDLLADICGAVFAVVIVNRVLSLMHSNSRVTSE
jgi:VanZ family protein